jgi:hypothetical protein
MTSSDPSVIDLGISASEVAGKQMLTRLFLASSLVPFETAAGMRNSFRIGHRSHGMSFSSRTQP